MINFHNYFKNLSFFSPTRADVLMWHFVCNFEGPNFFAFCQLTDEIFREQLVRSSCSERCIMLKNSNYGAVLFAVAYGLINGIVILINSALCFLDSFSKNKCFNIVCILLLWSKGGVYDLHQVILWDGEKCVMFCTNIGGVKNVCSNYREFFSSVTYVLLWMLVRKSFINQFFSSY